MKVSIVCRRSRSTMHGSAVAPFSSPRLIRLIWHIILGCCCLDATWLPATSALMATISRGKSINNSWRRRQARSHNKFHLIKLIKMLCNYLSWRELRDKIRHEVYILSAVIFEVADKTISSPCMGLIFIILNVHRSEINASVKEVLSVWHTNVLQILNYRPFSVFFVSSPSFSSSSFSHYLLYSRLFLFLLICFSPPRLLFFLTLLAKASFVHLPYSPRIFLNQQNMRYNKHFCN